MNENTACFVDFFQLFSFFWYLKTLESSLSFYTLVKSFVKNYNPLKLKIITISAARGEGKKRRKQK